MRAVEEYMTLFICQLTSRQENCLLNCLSLSWLHRFICFIKFVHVFHRTNAMWDMRSSTWLILNRLFHSIRFDQQTVIHVLKWINPYDIRDTVCSGKWKWIIYLLQAFNGKKWEKFNSEKVATLAYARIQGKAALIAHFQNSSLMNEDKRCRPILFHTDGPNAGDPVSILDQLVLNSKFLLYSP